MIDTLPTPDTLALPLPAGATVVAPPGKRIRCGETVATCGADIIAPADGDIGDIVYRPLATAPACEVDCLMLHNVRTAPHQTIATNAPLTTILKKSGVVGLGGAAFPASGKWRQNLRLFIVNGVESHPALSCDKALMAAAGDTVSDVVEAVGRLFAKQTLLAVAEDFSHSAGGDIIRKLPVDYAIGNERLLIKHLTGIAIPPSQPPADFGIVCFNIGTVFAMHAAIQHGIPMYSRVITVLCEGRSCNIRVPFGATVEDVSRFIGAPLTNAMADDLPIPTNAVIGATTTLIRLNETLPAAAHMPCIRCGACDAVCPVHISPLQLYALSLDEKWAAMDALRLDECLACCRCDAVCPSNIPLTRVFIQNKLRLTERREKETRRTDWQAKYNRHLHNLDKQPAKPSKQSLKNTVAAILGNRHNE